MEIKSEIKFGNENIKEAYKKLDNRIFQENQLKEWLIRAFQDLEKNAFVGFKYQKS